MLNPADVALVASMLCGETRGLEEKAGKEAAWNERAAIVQTVINRVHHRGFGGRTIRGVVTAKEQYATGKGCGRREARQEQYVSVARGVLSGETPAPDWARNVYSFTTMETANYMEKRWSKLGFVRVRGTNTVHAFFMLNCTQGTKSLSKRD